MAFDPREFAKLPDHPVIGWWPSGTVDEQTVLDYYAGLAGLAGGASLHRYCDFSAVENFSFGYRVLEKLVMFRKAKLAEHRRISLIMVSTAALGYGMARMYEALMTTAEMDIHVCRTVADAARILDLDEAALARP